MALGLVVSPRFIVAGFALTVLLGCSSNALTSGGLGKSKDDDEGDEAAEGDGDLQSDDESEKGGIPQEVTGTYLTCGVADDFVPQDPKNEPRGCGFFDKDGKKLVVDLLNPYVTLKVDELKFSVETKIAPETSRWHIHFAVPVEFKDHLKGIVIDVSYNGKKSRFETDTVSVLGDWQIVTIGSGSSASEGFVAMTEPPAEFQYVLFVTSKSFAPGSDTPTSFNSPSSATERCKEAARPHLGNISNNWVALIAGPTPLPEALTSMTHDVLNAAGERVLSAGADYTKLLKPIAYDELGDRIPEDIPVWTGVEEDGTLQNDTCNGWMNLLSIEGDFGDPWSLEGWLGGSDMGCRDQDDTARLYCLSLPEAP